MNDMLRSEFEEWTCADQSELPAQEFDSDNVDRA